MKGEHRKLWILALALTLASASIHVVLLSPHRSGLFPKNEQRPDQLVPVSPKITVGQFATGFDISYGKPVETARIYGWSSL
jgi:hypothetical protein